MRWLPRSFATTTATALALAAAFQVSTPVLAQSTSLIPRWEFEVGSFFTRSSTDIRADSQSGDLGTAFNAEDLLGLEKSKTVLRVAAARRLGQRHQVRLRYSKSSRDGQVQIPFEIDIGEVTFPVTATVDTKWDFTFTDVSYTYFFSLKEKTAWGAAFGLARWDFDIDLRGSGGGVNRSIGSDIDVDELVPELGVAVRHRLSPKLMFRSGLTGLTADLGEEEVTVIGATLRLDYQAFKNAGIAIAGTYSNVDYANGKGRFIGQYDYTITGVQVFIPIYID